MKYSVHLIDSNGNGNHVNIDRLKFIGCIKTSE